MTIEDRLCLARYLRYRDDGSVIFGEHKLNPDFWRCSCGYVGTRQEFEVPYDLETGCPTYMCPVQELEVEEQRAMDEARKKAAGAVCVICGVNWVDVMEGFDTCTTCQPRKGG